MSEPIHISDWVRRNAPKHTADGALAVVDDPEPRDLDADATRAHNRDIALAMIESHVPLRFRRARADHPAVLAWVERYRHNPEAADSLLLLGRPGTGKTYQAYGALRALAETGTRPVPWRAITEADLYGQLRPRDGVDSEAVFGAYAEAPLLILDDLGTAKRSEWTEELVYRLVNHRYGQCLPTVITSNVEARELGAAVGDRVASRLVEMAARVVLTGPDRRRSQR